MKVRKRPIIVDGEPYCPGLEDGINIGGPYLKTLEGNMHISPGDWILTGIKGERYPIKKDIFKETYDPIIEVTHIETPDRNYFYAKCPFCETKNSITFNPEAEVQFRTCEKCEKQFIADWSKVR